MATPNPQADATAQYLYAPNAAHNILNLNTVKFLSAAFAGAVAGILGLENYAGFALFIASTIWSTVCMFVVNCRAKPQKYVQNGWKDLLNPGQDNAFTFVLVWTLFYGIVHVYD
ncbi:transmembrane protein 93 [Moniliophthora roreri MCA 2997]|uniref:ER membrane protein complex subunit 6 n=2 Tax=Moniliophthora roreri TaxID=221103 RepID=V2X160_MONRO|nr:transmembrane protein 93 [Moniliophthora roreri MCA 2997]